MSFIIGSALAIGLMGKKGFVSSIFFAGVLLIIAGIFAPVRILQGSLDQFVLGFLVATAMGAQNASTAATPIGRTTHITGVSTEFGAALARMDRKNSLRLGLFLLCFTAGAFVAFFLQSMVGQKGFILVGAGLVLAALFQKKYGF